MIEIDWGDANETILIWTFYGQWSSDDLMNAIDASMKLVEQRTHNETVHTLVDFQHSNHLPSNMFAIGKRAIEYGIASQSQGMIVIINQSDLWTRLYDVLQKIVPNSLNIHFAKDANEAYAIMSKAHDHKALSK